MKRFLFSIVILCFTQLVYSQITIKSFVGANVAWQSNSELSFFIQTDLDLLDKQFTSILLPYVGLQFQKQLGKKFGLSLENQISFKGEQVANNGFSIKLMYLKFIPSLEFELTKGFKCGAGGFLGVKLMEFLPEFLPYRKPIINLYDYGGMASLSYSYKRLTFRAAYYQSVNVTYILFNKSKKQNRLIQIGLGYRFIGADFKNRKRR